MVGVFQMSDGDWPCPNPGCSNINFARRSACNRCQTPRPEGFGGDKPKPKGGTDFRGPPGLFQPGDWTCNTCGNVNWERRSECNMCKSSKPGMSGQDEKRDGAGGGFNERQERVASAKTEVGEDGYDDFGMKKKKGKASKAEREAAALARLHQSYSALYQPPDSAIGSSSVNSLSESNEERDTAAVSANLKSLDPGRRRWRSRSPSASPRHKNLSRRHSRSREEYRRSSSRDKKRRRELSPADRDGGRRRRTRSRGRSISSERDRTRYDRRYR